MAASHDVDPGKAGKYAIAASKGFSYYLPKSAQRYLQELLNQLPSTARSIYNEYYRDIMCAKACAPDSAVAMTKFVTVSFPRIARIHNAFAREMNIEIDSDVHEGYFPIKFPIVAKLETPLIDEHLEDPAATSNTVHKRRRAPTTSAPLFIRENIPDKMTKTRHSSKKVTSATPAITTPPLPPPGQDLITVTATEISIANLHSATDSQRLTPESIRSAEDEHQASPQHEYDIAWPHTSSPLSDAPSSALSSAPSSATGSPPEELALQSAADGEQNSPQDGLRTVSDGDGGEEVAPLHHSSAPDSSVDDLSAAPTPVSDAEKKIGNEAASLDTPYTPLPSSKYTSLPSTSTPAPDTAVPQDSPLFDSPHAPDSEEARWQDGMRALEEFNWERGGSKWLNGRGRVSVHFGEVGLSGGLFVGSYWDDGDEDEDKGARERDGGGWE